MQGPRWGSLGAWALVLGMLHSVFHLRPQFLLPMAPSSLIMIASRTMGGTSQETINLRAQPFHVCQMYLLPDRFINGGLHQGQSTNTRSIRVLVVNCTCNAISAHGSEPDPDVPSTCCYYRALYVATFGL